MRPSKSQYPDHLNPFGDEDDNSQKDKSPSSDDYPDALSPFDCDDDQVAETKTPTTVDDYDDSLNPFGDEPEDMSHASHCPADVLKISNPVIQIEADADKGVGNPFDDDEQTADEHRREKQHVAEQEPEQGKNESVAKTLDDTQPDSLEPPKPLPRTKSLLKKEIAKGLRQQSLSKEADEVLSPSQSIALPDTSLSSSTANGANISSVAETFQRRKHKRNAPPVPVNFKRQVTGSLEAIEEELNEIGDKLMIIEKDSAVCQETLKKPQEPNDPEGLKDFSMTRSKYIELIKRRHSIVRRQRELMYKKRELKLDQIHSDIEYELRMINNKQLRHKTPEDEAKEKELLKKLVEIVEEKNDIVENLNKDMSCDSQEIEEALRRLNIAYSSNQDSNNQPSLVSDKPRNNTKSEPCDKKNLVKFSKIATLLPRSSTLKDTIKIKRKRLFKKKDSHALDRQVKEI